MLEEEQPNFVVGLKNHRKRMGYFYRRDCNHLNLLVVYLPLPFEQKDPVNCKIQINTLASAHETRDISFLIELNCT